jgi:ribulose-phosphate 3-epimerase
MSYKAGFGGQKFNPKVIEKVIQLNSVRKDDNTPFKIHLDGGINEKTIREVVKEGADEVSVGRSLFSGKIEGNIDKLVKAAHYES